MAAAAFASVVTVAVLLAVLPVLVFLQVLGLLACGCGHGAKGCDGAAGSKAGVPVGPARSAGAAPAAEPTEKEEASNEPAREEPGAPLAVFALAAGQAPGGGAPPEQVQRKLDPALLAEWDYVVKNTFVEVVVPGAAARRRRSAPPAPRPRQRAGCSAAAAAAEKEVAVTAGGPVRTAGAAPAAEPPECEEAATADVSSNWIPALSVAGAGAANDLDVQGAERGAECGTERWRPEAPAEEPAALEAAAGTEPARPEGRDQRPPDTGRLLGHRHRLREADGAVSPLPHAALPAGVPGGHRGLQPHGQPLQPGPAAAASPAPAGRTASPARGLAESKLCAAAGREPKGQSRPERSPLGAPLGASGPGEPPAAARAKAAGVAVPARWPLAGAPGGGAAAGARARAVGIRRAADAAPACPQPAQNKAVAPGSVSKQEFAEAAARAKLAVGVALLALEESMPQAPMLQAKAEEAVRTLGALAQAMQARSLAACAASAAAEAGAGSADGEAGAGGPQPPSQELPGPGPAQPELQGPAGRLEDGWVPKEQWVRFKPWQQAKLRRLRAQLRK